MDLEMVASDAQEGNKQELKLWLRLLATTKLMSQEIRRRLRREFGSTLPQFDLLAQLTGNLTDNPPQPRDQPVEGHHAGAHQAFLQLGIDPRLLQQQGFRIAVTHGQGFFQIEQVGGGLKQCA